ncbi:MAG: thioredoxin domain-containing protein [Candidatus Woesearchaeota archaeon]
MRREKRIGYIVLFLAVALAAASFLFMSFIIGCSNTTDTDSSTTIITVIIEGDSSTDILAKCLTSNGIRMFGAEWCSHCQNQKKMFGDSFQYVDYVDCDKRRDECASAKVSGFPTWIVNGKNYPGEQSLSRLASLAGCGII